MTLRKDPNDQELKHLHQAYRAYMETEPWRELTDRNPILITHTQTGQQALTIAMGHWRKEYGIAMYLDQKGQQEYRPHRAGTRNVPNAKLRHHRSNHRGTQPHGLPGKKTAQTSGDTSLSGEPVARLVQFRKFRPAPDLVDKQRRSGLPRPRAERSHPPRRGTPGRTASDHNRRKTPPPGSSP